MKISTFGLDASVMTISDSIGILTGEIEVEGTPVAGCALPTTNTLFLKLAEKYSQELVVWKILNSSAGPIVSLRDLKFLNESDALKFLEEVTEIDGLVGDVFE